MSMPSGVQYGRVTGRLIRAVLDGSDGDESPDGAPIPGATVTFRARVRHAKKASAEPPVTIFLDPVVAATDENGVLVTRPGQPGVWLVATDDPGMDPVIGSYTVTVAAPTITSLTWGIVVPSGGTVDLATAVPVPSAPAAALAEWAAVRGEVLAARDVAEASAITATEQATAASAARAGAETARDQVVTDLSAYATKAELAAAVGDTGPVGPQGPVGPTGETGPQGATGADLTHATAQVINARTGTAYTLVAGDAGKVVTLTNAAAITLTVPGSVFTTGQRVDALVLGAGMVTVVGSSCTVNGTPSLVSRARYSAFTVLFTSATTAVVVGGLGAA